MKPIITLFTLCLLTPLAALHAADVPKQNTNIIPKGWDPVQAANDVMERLIRVTAPHVKGAHDAEFVCVGDCAYIVEHDNDIQPGHGAGAAQYCVLTVVNLKTLAVEKIIPLAKSGQVFENVTLPAGMCFVPRIIRANEHTLRCYFASQPPKQQAQTWCRDFDLRTLSFENRIHKAKLKTSSGVFDMQPQYFHADAVAHGFSKPAKNSGLYLFDSFKQFDGKTYVAINNYPGKQNALTLVHDDLAMFEIIGHYNEPQSEQLSESAVNRLPDGTWMAICRNEGGNRNYRFTTSKDGKTWTVGKELPFVPNGTNSKPTFDKFGDIYYLGWQENTKIDGVGRSVFNIDVSRDCKKWEHKYRFESPDSFQYPTFHEHNGVIWLTVTQGHKGSTDRIMFGKLEIVNGHMMASVASSIAPWIRMGPGTFTMGALPGAGCLRPSRPVEAVHVHGKKVRVDEYQGPHWDEQPVHDVHIARPFEIGIRRVTLGDFLRYKPEHADVYASRSVLADPGAPVTMVTWDEAQGYCEWLGKTEGSICRLPTEAEWEYTAGHALAPGLEGLGDGVREWCYDWWAPYAEAAETDPIGPAGGIVRVIRGRVDDLGRFRITDRSGGLPEERLPDVSFRVARVHGTTGQHRVSPPQDKVFCDVVQSPKSWKRDGASNTPVFHGGQIYIDRNQANAALLPYWGRHHVPSIAWCDNGDLLATVFTAPNDGSDQMAVLITRLRDGAETWDLPARFFILPDRDVDAAILYRDDDGVLYHFNAMGKDALAEMAARRVSRDNGVTWSKPDIVRFHRSIGEADAGFHAELSYIHLDLVPLGGGALAMARDVVRHRPYGSALFKSVDRGMSWHEMTRLGWQAANFGKQGEQAGWIAGWHAAVAVLRDGRFMAIGRTCDIDGRAPLSRSADHGRTWTYAPSDFSPISSSQRPVIKRLAEGPLMLVHYTDSSENKGPSKGIEVKDIAGKPRRVYGTFTALSFDEGVTWSHHKLLPVSIEEPYTSDPTGYYSSVQTPDGMIHLISTHRYYRFNLAWLKKPMPAGP